MDIAQPMFTWVNHKRALAATGTSRGKQQTVHRTKTSFSAKQLQNQSHFKSASTTGYLAILIRRLLTLAREMYFKSSGGFQPQPRQNFVS